MGKIVLRDRELSGLVPRYKKIQSDLSNLAHEINQMINRLEPALLATQEIDMRLTSVLRNLQNCEERVGILITQIMIAGEKFEASNRRVIEMSDELIYAFKQIIHQMKGHSAAIVPLNADLIEDKQIIEEMFEAKGRIDSVKLGYIAEVAGIRASGGDAPANIDTSEE